MTHPRRASPLRTAATIGALSIAALLASCGGSDDGTPTPPPATSNTPPASASASVQGFISYLKTVVPTRPETTDPLDVTAFVAPIDDLGDPDPGV